MELKMNITPIEIQTAGICLEIAAFEEFHHLTSDEVRSYQSSIQDKIWEHDFHINCHLTESYVDHLSQRAIEVLLKCRQGAQLHDASWIIRQISSSEKQTYLH